MNELDLSIPAPTRTYGSLALSPDGRQWIISKCEPHVAIRLKKIFPALPQGSAGPFKLPHNLPTDTDLAWFMERYPLAIETGHREALDGGKEGYLRLQASMERILLPGYQAPVLAGLQPGEEIRPYQHQAIDLCYARLGLLLGDDCGTGKTYTAAGFALKPGVLPMAVVCQVHLQKQWKQVIEGFTTLRVHAITKASAYNLPEADIYVFRYSQLMGWVDIFSTGMFKSVVYDEPQELRTGTVTAKGTAARVLSRNATWRLGLTGTPVMGYGVEIWHVMQFINEEVLGSWSDFEREYVVTTTKRLRDPKAVGTYLREQHVFIRRTKDGVGSQLPPLNKVIDFVESDHAAVKSIEDVAYALALRASTGTFIERGNAARDLDILVRQATGVAKAKQVAQVVRIIIESGEPVMLVGWHRAVYDIWLRELADLKPLMHTGSESPTQKEAAKKAFMAGESDLFITSLRSTAGIDGFQYRCSVAVIGELDWAAGTHHQVLSRLDREHQTKPVLGLFLVTDDGSDPVIMEVLGIKGAEARHVVDPYLGVQQVHSDETHLKKLVLRYLGKAGAAETKAASPVIKHEVLPATVTKDADQRSLFSEKAA